MTDPYELVPWLVSADLDAPDGHCLSWWNPGQTGFAYPEVSGLLLHLLALAGVAPARRERLRRALLREYDTAGAISRGAQSYTFDTAMALRGVLAHAGAAARAGAAGEGAPGEVPGGAGDVPGYDAAAERAVRGWTSLLIKAAEQGDPAAGSGQPGSPTKDTRWSMAFGAHQAKVCGALLDAGRLLGPLPGLDDAVASSAGAALDVQDDDGRFRIHAASPMTYAHSHCYAVEGLLMLAAAGPGGTPGEVLAGAEWLAAAQQPDGSIRAWHDCGAASGPPRADATAQALRIWVLVDRDRFADAAARARAFLARLRVPPLGLRYEPGSDDVNAAATIFAAQAIGWHADPRAADAARIV